MNDINMTGGTINITEQTLKELLAAVKKTKDIGRSVVMVESSFSDISFVINLETIPNTQESLGYSTVSVKHSDIPEVLNAPYDKPCPEWIDIRMLNKPSPPAPPPDRIKREDGKEIKD